MAWSAALWAAAALFRLVRGEAAAVARVPLPRAVSARRAKAAVFLALSALRALPLLRRLARTLPALPPRAAPLMATEIMLLQTLLRDGAEKDWPQAQQKDLWRHICRRRAEVWSALAALEEEEELPAWQGPPQAGGEQRIKRLLPPALRERREIRYLRVNTLTDGFLTHRDREPGCEEEQEEVEEQKEEQQENSLLCDDVPALAQFAQEAGNSLAMFEPDNVVPHLYRCRSLHDVSRSKAVGRGRVVLQDKASCFPAVALLESYHRYGSHTNGNDGGGYGEPVDGDVIDACAAPGNKTLHVAAILEERRRAAAFPSSSSTTPSQPAARAGTVWAFDRDEQRARLLEQRVRQHNAQHVVRTECIDFLAIDPAEPRFANVTHILLDPSCSGSGIASSVERQIERVWSANPGKALQWQSYRDVYREVTGKPPPRDSAQLDDTPRRLRTLAAFQRTILMHALRFPAVRRISYSTCSVHDEENECVVAAVLMALQENSDNDKGHQWRIVPCLPQWPRRGRAVAGLTHEQASALVRCDPDLDETNGFFVACFERTADAPSVPPPPPAPVALAGRKRRLSQQENGHNRKDEHAYDVAHDDNGSDGDGDDGEDNDQDHKKGVDHTDVADVVQLAQRRRFMSPLRVQSNLGPHGTGVAPLRDQLAMFYHLRDTRGTAASGSRHGL